MVTIDSLTFDLSDCSLHEQSAWHRQWMSSAGTAYLLRFNLGPIDWSFDLTNPVAASDFYRAQCVENGGAMLAMDLVTIAGVEILRGLFKYRAPVPDSQAKCYVGILWLPFREGRFQINIEAMEYGTSGMREAVVMMFKGDAWPKPDPEIPSTPTRTAEEMFERLGSAPIIQLPSDDERYDEMFPNHPLSQVRARLAKVLASLELDADLLAWRPFRVDPESALPH